MKLKINIRDIGWWFAATILPFIVLSLAGWLQGYYVVMVLGGLQVLYFTWRERSLMTIPAQVRIVYLVLSLFGFYKFIRIPIYVILLVGTFMVVFFDKCSIELVLRLLPWNKNK